MNTVPIPAATHIVEVYYTRDNWPDSLLLNIYVCGIAHATEAAEPYQAAGRVVDIIPVGPIVAQCAVCLHDLVKAAADRAAAAVAALPTVDKPDDQDHDELAGLLRDGAAGPTELAAINLLIAADLHTNPHVAARIDTTDQVAAVDWRSLQRDVWAGVLDDIDARQGILLHLALAFATDGSISPDVLVEAVRERPDPVDRQVLAGLIVAAFRTALSEPAGGAR